MTGNFSRSSHLTSIGWLHTEKIAEAILPYVIKMGFPASLLYKAMNFEEEEAEAIESSYFSPIQGLVIHYCEPNLLALLPN